jgi:hypothetical protein
LRWDFGYTFCEVMVSFHSFACGYRVALLALIKESVFLYCAVLAFLSKTTWRNVRIYFLGSLFCSSGLCICFDVSTMLFWLLQICSEFKIRYCDASVFFLKIVLVIGDNLWFYMYFIIVYSIFWNTSLGILIGIALSP